MAFILTPRLAPAYQAPQCSPFGFCGPASQPAYSYRVARPRPQRPQYSSFAHFFSQMNGLLNEIDEEAQREAQIEAQRQAHLAAQREAHRQRQLRKRALRAKFGVSQTEKGWQVDGDIHGFDQENISIEITDEQTLRIAGNTEWQAEKKTQPEQQQPDNTETAPVVEQPSTERTTDDNMDGVTLNQHDFESVTKADSGATTPDSDTASNKSYQPTVEDDFEDLGAETSSLISSPSRPSSPAKANESKGKEKAVEEPVPSDSQQPQAEAPLEQQQQESQQEERVHGSFERTFRFPQRIDAANVSASFKEGALQITVPRAQVQQARRIAIL